MKKSGLELLKNFLSAQSLQKAKSGCQLSLFCLPPLLFISRCTVTPKVNSLLLESGFWQMSVPFPLSISFRRSWKQWLTGSPPGARTGPQRSAVLEASSSSSACPHPSETTLQWLLDYLLDVSQRLSALVRWRGIVWRRIQFHSFPWLAGRATQRLITPHISRWPQFWN